MRGILKQAGILGLIIILGLQINYIFEEFFGYTEWFQKAVSLISTIFAILFIVGLVMVYQIIKINRERARYSSHDIISNTMYEDMKIRQTRSQVNKLKNSAAYQYYIQQGKPKPGHSQAKTHSSMRDQQHNQQLPTEEEFERLWMSQEQRFFGIQEE